MIEMFIFTPTDIFEHRRFVNRFSESNLENLLIDAYRYKEQNRVY